jgi:hypothetical protein
MHVPDVESSRVVTRHMGAERRKMCCIARNHLIDSFIPPVQFDQAYPTKGRVGQRSRVCLIDNYKSSAHRIGCQFDCT